MAWEKQQQMTQVFGPLPLMREIQKNLLAPGFSLAQTREDSWEVNQKLEELLLSSSLSDSVFQTNKYTSFFFFLKKRKVSSRWKKFYLSFGCGFVCCYLHLWVKSGAYWFVSVYHAPYIVPDKFNFLLSHVLHSKTGSSLCILLFHNITHLGVLMSWMTANPKWFGFAAVFLFFLNQLPGKPKGPEW